MYRVIIHPPSSSASAQAPPSGFQPPKIEWLCRTWYVTHSTLPMWKSKRDVAITYKALEPLDDHPRLDDVVSYRKLDSDKEKTVHGVDTAVGVDGGSWNWRGKGMLAIATSHWEILGSGDIENVEWVVTYFAKTLFTPAGIDVYCSRAEGVPKSVLNGITNGLAQIKDSDVARLAESLFNIKHERG